jgi:hypothetical protein
VSKPNEESAFESAQAQTSRDLDYISFTEGWRAALAAAQPAGPSATESVSRNTAEIIAQEILLTLDQDFGATVPNERWADAGREVADTIQQRSAEYAKAAQPKAPSPSEFRYEFSPERMLSPSHDDSECDVAAGSPKFLQAPSPTPGEVERDVESLRLYAHGYADTCRSDAKRDHIKRRADAYAANLRAAQPAQGWVPIEQLTDRSKVVLLGRRHKSEPNALSDALGLSLWHNRLSIGSPDDNVAWPWDDEPPTHYCELPGDVPTPPNAEPGERSGG